MSETNNKNSPSAFKWFTLGVGALIGVAHIGVLGHLLNAEPSLPIINLPVGDYTSYKVTAGKEGYKIEYKSNDPLVMGVKKFVDKENGFFGVGGRSTSTYDEEYTMEGARHLGGAGQGKLTAKKLECIKAEGGGESNGALVGTSIGAAAAPFVTGIPYIGWLAAGWITMFGQKKGAEIGGSLATMVSGCDENIE
jgi:hypothetical protein